MGTSWQRVGALYQLTDKGQAKEVMFTAQASLMDSSWLSQVVFITASEMSGSAILQLTGSEREVMWPAHNHTASSGRARMVNPGLCPVPSTHTAAVWVTLQMMRTNWQNLQPWLLLPVSPWCTEPGTWHAESTSSVPQVLGAWVLRDHLVFPSWDV